MIEEQNWEVAHIICEIRAKNGLPSVIDGYRMNEESEKKKSSTWVVEHYMSSQEIQPSGKSGKAGKKKRLEKERHSARAEGVQPKLIDLESKPQETSIPDHPSGKLSLIQSNYGNKGNFELVVPLAKGGLAYYSRNNDQEELPWTGPVEFGMEAGRIDGVSLIQSDFGPLGNLEVITVDNGGHNLMHFWRDSGPSYDWHGPFRVSEESQETFSGSPAMIWSNFGKRGNFDVIVPRAKGGFYHYWRENDHPSLNWNGPFDFAVNTGRYEAATLIQSNFGDPGSLEMIARCKDKLVFFWRDSAQGSKWNGPQIIATGVAGAPGMIQSTFGKKGNFELVVPMVSGGLAHYWRNNDDEHLPWSGPQMFGLSVGMVESVSLIQSNFGEPGHLELAALADGQLALFWRDSGPDFRWNGPLYLTS
jgi:hypothetical protein